MEYRAYSNQGFLFQETLRVARLLADGCSAEAVKRAVIEDDLLALRSVQSRKTIAAALLERWRGIAPSFVAHVLSAAPDAQRALVLLLIARGHRLLSETLLELGRWHSVGAGVTAAALRGFFARCRAAEATLDGWSEATFQKSVVNIVAYLGAARLLGTGPNGDWVICVPLLSPTDRCAVCGAMGAWGLRALLQAESPS